MSNSSTLENAVQNVCEREPRHRSLRRRSSLSEIENQLGGSKPSAAGIQMLMDAIREERTVEQQQALATGLCRILEKCIGSQFSLGEKSYVRPGAYFECGLRIEDCIALPAIDLNSLRGLSFSCMFCLLADHTDGPANNPSRFLFELLSVEGGGIRAYFSIQDVKVSKGKTATQIIIIVEAKGPGTSSRWQTVKAKVPVEFGYWHHIAVVLATPYLQADECRVFIDGVAIVQHPMTYPKLNGPTDHNCFCKSFGGLMAEPTLYSGALEAQQVYAMIKKLPRQRVASPIKQVTMLPFCISDNRDSIKESFAKRMTKALLRPFSTKSDCDDEAESQEKTSTIIREFRHDNEVDAEGKILFFLDPRCCFSGVRKEMTHSRIGTEMAVLELYQVNGSRVQTELDRIFVEPEPVSISCNTNELTLPNNAGIIFYARLRGSLKAVVEADEVPSMEGLGGVENILELLSMLVPPKVCESLDIVVPRTLHVRSRLTLEALLTCLASAIEFREQMRDRFVSLGGIFILGMILESVNPDIIASPQACLGFTMRLGYADPTLVSSAAEALLFNPRIWCRTHPSIQEYWASMVKRFVSCFPHESVGSFYKLLDILLVCDSCGELYSDCRLVAPQPLSTMCIEPVVESCIAILEALVKEGDKETATPLIVSCVQQMLDFAYNFPCSASTTALLQSLAKCLLPKICPTSAVPYPEQLSRAIFSALIRCGGVDVLLSLGVEKREFDTKRSSLSAVPKHPSVISAAVSGIAQAARSPKSSSTPRSGSVTSRDFRSPSAAESVPAALRNMEDNFQSSDLSKEDNADVDSDEDIEETIEYSKGGLLSSSGGVPAATRAAMILLIGRMIQLHRNTVVASVKQNQPADTVDRFIEENTERIQKQFGILLRSTMKIHHISSFRCSRQQRKRIARDVTPEILEALAALVLGMSTPREADDMIVHDESYTLALPEALPVLGAQLAALHCCSNETKDIAARSILLKLSIALKASYAAREQVTSLPRWQSWLIPVVLLSDNSLEGNDDESMDYLLGEVSTDLLCLLMEHETQRPNDDVVYAKKLHRVQFGFSSWQGLKEQMTRITRERERSKIVSELEEARTDPKKKHLIPLINANAELSANMKMVRFVRLLCERAWERILSGMRANGLTADSYLNFCMTLAMSEETLIRPVNLLRLSALTPGGVISSSSAAAFSCVNTVTGLPIQCTARAAIDGRPDTKWVDVGLDYDVTSWVSYQYGDIRGHRVVFYIVASAYDNPDLDPAGWTLFGRQKDDGSGWVVLDRRTEVRFQQRYQKIPCWVRRTGVFDEYRIVFDPPTAKRTRQMRAVNGDRVVVKVQIGEVSFFEMDVGCWDTDISPSEESFSREQLQLREDLDAYNGELVRFLDTLVKNIVQLREILGGLSSKSLTRILGRDRPSLRESQQVNMPQRAILRIVGHILRNPMEFPESVINGAVKIAQSLLAKEFHESTEANTAAQFTLLYCIRESLLSMQNENPPGDILDAILALGITIVCNYKPHAHTEANAMQRFWSVVKCYDMALGFLGEWRIVNDIVMHYVEAELESEATCRNVSFIVERMTSSTMARRANPVEVAAYGAGKMSAIGLPRIIRRKFLDRLGKHDMELFTKQLFNKIRQQQSLIAWRKLLESQEIRCYQIFSDSFEPSSRSNILRLVMHDDTAHLIPTVLCHDPNGNPHDGACSGITDRKLRREEKLDAQKDAEHFGAELSRQVSILDESLVTHDDADNANASNPEVTKSDDVEGDVLTVEVNNESAIEASPASKKLVSESRRISELTIDTSYEQEKVEDEYSPIANEEDYGSLIQQRDKLTIEEWLYRKPNPFRGEPLYPWPTLSDPVLTVAGCRIVRPEFLIRGRLIVTQRKLYFDPDPPDADKLYLLRSKKLQQSVTDDSDFAGLNSERWFQDLSEHDRASATLARARFLQRKNKFRERKVWSLDSIKHVFLRRYHMRNSAVEIFFDNYDTPSLLIDMEPSVSCTLQKTDQPDEYDVVEEQLERGTEVRNRFMNKIWSVLPMNVKIVSHRPDSDSSKGLLAKYTEQWQQRKMTNFEYLMRLNILAGRSVDDLTQYPVFPWVLSDYTSEEINLEDPSVYRDLSLPMGALTPDRLEEGRERYRTFDDPQIPKFHWGSHYSTKAGVVLYFLVRMEPFTSIHIQMQDGHFDVPDRLFNSVAGAWEMCTTVMSEVKELIPEFYCQPAFLRNHSKFDLGTAQDGIKVNDVILPPWAKGSAERFVNIMRLALESDYVSERLHLWIDLIFGNKARLPDAAKADNVFYYLTYPGAIDVESITNPAMLQATELQIANFGQCPAQVLSKPHPPRGPPPGKLVPLGRYLMALNENKIYKQNGRCVVEIPGSGNETPLMAMKLLKGRALVVHFDGTVVPFLWGRTVATVHGDSSATAESDDDFVIDDDVPPPLMIRAEIDDPSIVNKLPMESLRRTSACAIGWSSSGRIFAFSGLGMGTIEVCFFDSAGGTFRTRSVTLFAHIGDVTAIAVDDKMLVSGSIDGSMRVWTIKESDGDLLQRKRWGVSLEPDWTLVGHENMITAIDINYSAGTSVSVSQGRCLLHSLHNGALLGAIPGNDFKVARLSRFAGIVAVAYPQQLSVFSNTSLCEPFATVDLNHEAIRDMQFSQQNSGTYGEQMIITIGDSGLVKIFSVYDNVRLVATIEVFPLGKSTSPLRCMCIHESEQAMLVGAVSGEILLVPLPNIVSHGHDASIPFIGDVEANTKFLNARNAVLSKVEGSKVVATARGVVTEVSSVASKFAKGIGFFRSSNQ